LLCRKRKILVFILVLSACLGACGSEPAPAATPTPALTPLEIAGRAAEVMLVADSLHFTIERDGALAYIDANQLLAFKRAEGDYVLPDRMKTVVRVVTAFTPVDIGMVVLGDDQYATEPVTGAWGRLPTDWGQFNLMVLFEPDTGLQKILRDGVVDLALVGSEEIEQQPHYHLAGRVDGELMSAATLGFIGHGDVDLEVWIGAQDYHVRRLLITEPETDPTDPTTWELVLSQWGQPVEINAPPIPDS
jgi:lipoprotein LprG